jgi:hypothetical protein
MQQDAEREGCEKDVGARAGPCREWLDGDQVRNVADGRSDDDGDRQGSR